MDAAAIEDLRIALNPCGVFTISNRIANAEHSPLFKKLPAELRNRVYEYALIEAPPSSTPPQTPLFVAPDYKPPALLSVCHQLRKEARDIWRTGNVFGFRVVDFDLSLPLRFRNVVGARVCIAYAQGSPNPLNLYFSIEEAFRTKCHFRLAAGADSPSEKVIIAAMRILELGLQNQRKWAEIEERVFAFMAGLAVLDPAWDMEQALRSGKA